MPFHQVLEKEYIFSPRNVLLYLLVFLNLPKNNELQLLIMMNIVPEFRKRVNFKFGMTLIDFNEENAFVDALNIYRCHFIICKEDFIS